MPAGHHGLDLSDSAGAQREVYHARVGDANDIFEAHAAETSEALQYGHVEEVFGGRVGQSRLQERLHEVAAGLDGEHHACLQRACRAQLPDALQCMSA